MGGDFGEILVILVVALIVFGPQELPNIARKMGRVISSAKRTLNSLLFPSENVSDGKADEH